MEMPRARSGENSESTTDFSPGPRGQTRLLIGWQGRYGAVAKLAIHAGILAARGKSLYAAFSARGTAKGYCVGRIWLAS